MVFIRMCGKRSDMGNRVIHERREHIAEAAVQVQRGLRAVFHILYDVVQRVFQCQGLDQFVGPRQFEVVLREAACQRIRYFVHKGIGETVAACFRSL